MISRKYIFSVWLTISHHFFGQWRDTKQSQPIVLNSDDDHEFIFFFYELTMSTIYDSSTKWKQVYSTQLLWLLGCIKVPKKIVLWNDMLTHCSLVTQYGDLGLG